MTFRTSVFSISDGLSVSLLNISSEGVVLGRGRLIAPSASLGEVSSSVFPLERSPGCGSGVTSWQAEVKGWKVAHTGVTHRVIYIFVTNPCFQIIVAGLFRLWLLLWFRRVEVLGPEGLEFSSSHANLSLASHGHLRLHSNTGQVMKTMKINIIFITNIITIIRSSWSVNEFYCEISQWQNYPLPPLDPSRPYIRSSSPSSPSSSAQCIIWSYEGVRLLLRPHLPLSLQRTLPRPTSNL